MGLTNVDDLLEAAEKIEKYLEDGEVKKRQRGKDEVVPFPHSRNCNPTPHDHGTKCASDCPSCYGNPVDDTLKG